MTEQPHNPLADPAFERNLLGWMLWSREAVDHVIDLVDPTDFADIKHQIIWDAMKSVYDKGDPIDIHVVAHVMDPGQLAKIGGGSYLHDLAGTGGPPIGDPIWYAKKVSGYGRLRRLSAALVRGHMMIQQGDADPDQIVDLVEAEIMKANTTRGEDDFSSYRQIVDTHFDDLVNPGADSAGIPTGLKDLDNLIGGMKPGQLILIAARPGMGKSVSALNFLTAAARQGHPAMLFSLEMRDEELLARSFADAAKVRLNHIANGRLTEDDVDRLHAAREDVAGLPIWIDNNSTASLATIRAKARRMKLRNGLGVIGVDYLQLVETVHRPGGNRAQELGEVSRGLKMLAKELDVPVVACAQLNRSSESRQDKRPLLSDLRESGSLEQDSDVVILIHRDDYYDPETERAGEADFLVVKNRNGELDVVALGAQLHYSRFTNLG